MVAKPSGRTMEISQSTFQRLNDELLDALKLEVPDNGLRNSYASYGLSFRTLGMSRPSVVRHSNPGIDMNSVPLLATVL
jgi:hypothetical protein